MTEATTARMGVPGIAGTEAERLGRKRRRGALTALSSSVFWLVVALLYPVTRAAGLSGLSPLQLLVWLLLPASWIALNYGYYRTTLSLRYPIPFFWVTLASTTVHGTLLLLLTIADGFSWHMTFADLIGTVVVLAYVGLNAGIRLTMLWGLAATMLFALAYALTPHNAATVPPPVYALVVIASLIYTLVLGLMNEFNQLSKRQVVTALHQQSTQRETIQRQHEALEQANEVLRQMSMRDGLTQLANRRRFDEGLHSLWAQAGRRVHQRRIDRVDTPPALGLVLIDIDNFKPYNDCLGHLAGDDALRRVAAAIQTALLRDSDIAARYGGEEFAVLLPDTDLAGATRVAERIATRIRDLRIAHPASDVQPYLTVSLGVACETSFAPTRMAELVKQADEALYAAKHAGRDRIAIAAASTGRISPVVS